MNKINKNQKGFGTVESILVVIIVVLIGAVGFLVYKNHHKTAPVASATKTTIVKSTAPKTALSSTTTVVKVPELGIQITVPNSIKDLTYSTANETLPNGNVAIYAKFSTTSLTNLDAGCSTSFGPLGSLERASGQYPSSDQDASLDYGKLEKQFSTFYISAGSPQAACSQNSTTENTAQLDKGAFFNSLSTITVLGD